MASASAHLSRLIAFDDHWRFFTSFVRRPGRVGAIAPSSAGLARAILRRCPLKTAGVVVELGAGTGAITRPILDRIGPDTTFLALELDARHVELLRRRHPRATVCRESAEHLGALLSAHGQTAADCIVSGLPWGNMGRAMQDRIMGEIRANLRPGGRFCGFGYVHAGWYPSTRAFHRDLRAHFQQVRIGPVVWWNLPPAFAFRCS